jgi:transposase
LQTSDAVGAAAAQVGPNALALAAALNKELGIPASKVARILLQMCGIKITAGGVHQALARVARRAQATYQELVLAVRASAVVAPDETGWRIAGRKRWLWVFVGEHATVYLIAEGAAMSTPPGSSARTSPGCLSATGGRRTAASPRRATRHASRTCCGAPTS